MIYNVVVVKNASSFLRVLFKISRHQENNNDRFEMRIQSNSIDVLEKISFKENELNAELLYFLLNFKTYFIKNKQIFFKFL